jgi:chromosome segregation ATPase
MTGGSDTSAKIEAAGKANIVEIAPRFYIDYGVIHDRVTGKHVVTDGERPFEDDLAQVLDLLNSLTPPQAATEIASLRGACADAADLIKRQQGWQEYGEQLERNADAAMADEIQDQRRKNASLRERVKEYQSDIASMADEIHRLETERASTERERDAALAALREIADFVSGDNTTIGAIDRLAKVREIAARAITGEK